MLQILINQRSRIDTLGEDQIMLRTNINRLKTSIDNLSEKNHVFKMLNPDNFAVANKVNYKPTEYISFSSLKANLNPLNKKTYNKQNNKIDFGNLLQMSVNDFKKKKLKPIKK